MTYIEIPLNLEIVMFGLLHPYDANLIKNKIILLTIFILFLELNFNKDWFDLIFGV